MCIKLTVHYRCNCLVESLNPCPTFQKKRSGFWNGFFGAFKHEKHCGKVRRSRQETDGACDDCAIKARGLRPYRVGDGANLPRRKVADESFQEEPHDGGRRPPKHRRRRSVEKYRHSAYDQHDAVPTNANAWIPNLYDEAKRAPMAPPAEYGRKYAPAPPVCPPRPSKSTREREPARSSSLSSRRRCEKKSSGSSRGHGKSASHDRHSKPSTSDYSTREDWPLRAPALPRPALRPGGFRTQGPNGPPPEVPLPPLPKQARTFAQHMAAGSGSGSNSDRALVPSYSRPMRPYYSNRQQRPAVPPTSFVDMERQEAFKHTLRQKSRPVQRHEPPPPPLEVRPPLYKQYLEEQNSELMKRYGGRKPTALRPMPAVKPKPAEASKRSKMRDIGAALRFEHGDSDSDVSFACVDARKIEAGKSDAMSHRR
ncbi:hypothetical protein PG985_006658 [Apiospora marii]|uniref:Serine/arginine repetitive matrix protein 1-like n=1 Tax=Apiospora marii TaxID=335849 RepID=A0ABR1SA02_9PEZI